MDNEKIIQEQSPPDGCNLDSTVKSETIFAPDRIMPDETPITEPLGGDVPLDSLPDEVPASDEGVCDTEELVMEPVSTQDAEMTSDATDSRDSSGSYAELVDKVIQASAAVSGALAGISSEIHELHRLYHNEFAGRLKSMQDELDRYHDADRGNAFDGILGAIARIYTNNESLVDEISDPKTRKNVKYMLLDLSDLLEEYGVSMLKSEVGDKRNVRHCQIVERIPTDNPELHDTIAASHSTGFYKGNRTIIKELVDVYFFDRKSSTMPEAASGADTDKEADADIHVEAE